MMADRRVHRITAAIVLVTLVVLMQSVAFFLVGRSWIRSFPLPGDHLWGAFTEFQGELYFPSDTPDGLWCTIDALDMRTGGVRHTDLPFQTPWHGMVANDRLWLVTGSIVIETDGARQTRYDTQRAVKARFSPPFLYEGLPALIDLDDAGVKCRLMTFKDGQWHDRGEVGSVGAGRTWKEDDSGQMRLMPCKNCERTYTGGSVSLRVLTVAGVQHVFHFDAASGQVAYREGLDLMGSSEFPSAEDPENVAAESSDWSLLPFKPDFWSIIPHGDRLVALEYSSLKPTQIWEKRLVPGGQPFKLALAVNESAVTRQSLFESPVDRELYFVEDRRLSQKVSRYRDSKLEEIPVPWETTIVRVARWAARELNWIAAILIAGVLLVMALGEWLSHTQDVTYQYGLSSVRLAPVWRRCVARGLDVSLILAWLVVEIAGEGVTRLLIRTEEMLFLVESPEFKFNFDRALVYGLVVWFLIVCVQARSGVTPGKWLCGIRVVRSTLRSCGFVRSLLRELLFLADCPGLLMIAPGMVSLLVSNHRQRIGDLMADTLVVDVRQRQASPAFSLVSTEQPGTSRVDHL